MSKFQTVSPDAVVYGAPAHKPGTAPLLTVSYGGVGPICALSDAIMVVFASILGPVIYGSVTKGDIFGIDIPVGMGLLSALAYVAAGWRLEVYTVVGIQRLARDYLRILASWLFSALFVALTLFLLKAGADVSRGAAIVSSGLSLFLLLTWRFVTKKRIRSALVSGAIRGRRAILIGSRDELLFISPEYLLLTHGIQELERVNVPARSPHATGGLKLESAAVGAALEAARRTKAEEILVALSWADSVQLQLLLERLRISPLPVRLIPDHSIRNILEHGGSRVSLFEVQRAPMTKFEQALKRCFDVVASAFILLLLMPLLLITALAIKLDTPGPILFRQRRNGFNGQEFRIFKFKTMVVMEDGLVIAQAVRGDSRVTRLGRVLRRYSIDELPQLFNVVKGDMAIVGPRPHALAHDDEYSKAIVNYAYRHHVKPGLTGWAQVNGHRGATPHVEQMKQRVDSDIWYINNWSIWLDLQIVGKTFFELARARNAD
jgi:undecaprenyl-phosphate galactose phosphotransferase/putative colanic acid biosynthesis UDP-glucose lipid carrier transferase